MELRFVLTSNWSLVVKPEGDWFQGSVRDLEMAGGCAIVRIFSIWTQLLALVDRYLRAVDLRFSHMLGNARLDCLDVTRSETCGGTLMFGSSEARANRALKGRNGSTGGGLSLPWGRSRRCRHGGGALRRIWRGSLVIARR